MTRIPKDEKGRYPVSFLMFPFSKTVDGEPIGMSISNATHPLDFAPLDKRNRIYVNSNPSHHSAEIGVAVTDIIVNFERAVFGSGQGQARNHQSPYFLSYVAPLTRNGQYHLESEGTIRRQVKDVMSACRRCRPTVHAYSLI
jgi:hypothetical protein